MNSRKNKMKIKLVLCMLIATTVIVTGCDKASQPEAKDDKALNQPEVKKAVAPVTTAKQTEPPPAPTMSYEVVPVTDTGVGYGNEIFSFADRGENLMGNAINYQSRAGIVNVMEQVVDDVDATGYVAVERAYKFGDKYVLVVSTGESGNSCPATTYAFTYDTKSENVTGKKTIDGCSESVETFAENNKLNIKKEGKVTVIYNGEIQ